MITSSKSGKALLYKYKSYASGLQQLFPDIGIDPNRLPQSFWNNSVNRRIYFEDYARENGYDPLDPTEWYKQSKDKILSQKNTHKIINYHNKSLRMALLDLFPEIGLESHRLWSTLSNQQTRKMLFEKYAKDNLFDPLVPQEWYQQNRAHLLATEGIERATFYHGNSLAQALVDLFPSIGLDIDRLRNLFPSTGTWHSRSSRRRFFENYAKLNSFDALIPENWYKQERNKIMSTKGAAGIVNHFNKNLDEALVDSFPDIGLQLDKIKMKWSSLDNRRQFFINYANERGFDPYCPENWCSNLGLLKFDKKAQGVLSYYKENPVRALTSLFPDVQWDHSLLLKSYDIVWDEYENRRNYLRNFALKKGFDPFIAKNWYSQSLDEMCSLKTMRQITTRHGDSMAKAIVDLFPELNLARDSLEQKMWSDRKHRRVFFEEYANTYNFDALVPSNWYSHLNKVKEIPAASSILQHHSYSVGKAIMDLFPEMNFKVEEALRHNYRHNLEAFAKKSGISVLEPEGWYKLSRAKLSSIKGTQNILRLYDGSFTRLLLDLFPEVNFDASKLDRHNLKTLN